MKNWFSFWTRIAVIFLLVALGNVADNIKETKTCPTPASTR